MDGRGVEKGLSVSELYHRVFPEYLAMGMTYDQFWKGDCTLVIPYREAYRIRQEEMNRMAWLQGLYMYKALQSTPIIVHGFARRDTKIEPYPAKPLEFRKQGMDQKDEKAKRASEHIRRNMMAFISLQQADRKQKELRKKGGDGNGGRDDASARSTG